jgi:hypothetical protein
MEITSDAVHNSGLDICECTFYAPTIYSSKMRFWYKLAMDPSFSNLRNFINITGSIEWLDAYELGRVCKHVIVV